MKNQFDKNGKRHGLWESYYSNGNIDYRGSYKNGHRHGLWENYYYHSENPIHKGAYKRDNRIGLWYELNS